MRETNSRYFAALERAEFMVLTTYRRNGDAVPTTVWFAEADGVLYVTTAIQAGKTKRTRNNPKVTVAPSDRVGNLQGPSVPAVGRILDPHEHEVAFQVLQQKYGEQFTQVISQMDATRPPGSRVYLAIMPPEHM